MFLIQVQQRPTILRGVRLRGLLYKIRVVVQDRTIKLKMSPGQKNQNQVIKTSGITNGRNSLLLLGLPGGGVEQVEDSLILLLSLLRLQSLLCLLLR